MDPRLGFLEWRPLRAIPVLLLLIQACIASTSCTFPEFSHSNGEWLSGRSEQTVNWPKLRRSHSSRGNSPSFSSGNYTEWLAALEQTGRLKLRFAHTYESPTDGGTLQSGGTYDLSCITTKDLKAGDRISRLPIKSCLYVHRDGATPWEIRLASLLLQERAKGVSSEWASFMKLLPAYVPLPMFFTDMELQNIENSLVLDDISKMRTFVRASFRMVRGEEIAHAKFSEFAWMMSIVYSMACQHEDLYLLPPIIGTAVGEHNPNAFFSGSSGFIQLNAASPTKKGQFISVHRASTAMDAFIFQGVIPKTVPENWHRLFKDIDEISDWYFSHYGGVNRNRYLTATVARDALNAIRQTKPGSIEQSLSISSSGDISPDLLCVLASLVHASKSIKIHNNNQKDGESSLDFDNPLGTIWEQKAKIIAQRSRSYQATNMSGSEAEDRIFLLATKMLRKRARTLLASYTTDTQEDFLLLEAASWEGFNAGSEDLCSTCRFQIEKRSVHDDLVTGYEASRKAALQHFLKDDQHLSRKFSEEAPLSTASIHRFSSWCNEHGFSISEKTSISLLSDASLRGVVVLEDIEEGETLSTLPLDTGLFDASSTSTLIADSWDLAAARLLQEKSLGNASFWASYIGILPHDMASPIYLDSNDLQEVQWKPAIRELIQVRKAIRKSYRMLDPVQMAFADFKSYEWAAIMVHSRAFTLPVLPKEKYSHYVLMPYMDMINHHYVYQADWMSQPVIDGKLEIVAKRRLKKGEQLFASFGARSNDNLFLYYGFVLKDNPFDSAEIFRSFKDATCWFIQTWTNNCTVCSGGNAAYSSPCERSALESIWPIVKQAIEDFEGGSGGQSRDWWKLVSRWADLGYQYLPYQPGPAIYSYGICDPSLVAGLSAASSIVKLPQLHQVDTRKKQNRTLVLQEFFTCLEALERPTQEPLLSEHHPCRAQLVTALLAEPEDSRGNLIAQVSVALRCLQVLASLPTSIPQDRSLLQQVHPDRHIHLTREYRYRKKLLLKAVVERLVASGTGG